MYIAAAIILSAFILGNAIVTASQNISNLQVSVKFPREINVQKGLTDNYKATIRL